MQRKTGRCGLSLPFPNQPKESKPLAILMSTKWPTNKKESDYMKMRQGQNVIKSKKNENEQWFELKLKNCKHRFSKQKRWGYRIFDFWCHELGLAVEIDGPEHNIVLDNEKDQIEFKRSRIIVLRVRNLNETDAYRALKYISYSESWNERRLAAGMKPITT